MRGREDEPPRSPETATPIAQFGGLGSFAEQMLVHEHALVAIRQDMPLDKAALIGCAVTTGLGAVFNTAEVEPGSTVAVFGCGGIGLNCVQGARMAGAGTVIAVDRVASEARARASSSAPPTPSTPADADPVAGVIALTGGGVDYAFEAIGLKAHRRAGLRHAPPGRHRDGDRDDPARRRASRSRRASS